MQGKPPCHMNSSRGAVIAHRQECGAHEGLWKFIRFLVQLMWPTRNVPLVFSSPPQGV